MMMGQNGPYSSRRQHKDSNSLVNLRTWQTVRQDLRVLRGAAVSFFISPVDQPKKSFNITRAFTADQLGLAEHTYPVKALQRKYKHLRGLPLQALNRLRPLLLIGSDFTHLITPVEQVRLGPPGAPAAVKTRLGWALQGPTKHIKQQSITQQCLKSPPSPPLLSSFRVLKDCGNWMSSPTEVSG